VQACSEQREEAWSRYVHQVQRHHLRQHKAQPAFFCCDFQRMSWLRGRTIKRRGIRSD